MTFNSSLERRVANYRLAEQRAGSLTSVYSTPPIPALEIAERNGVDVEFTRFAGFEQIAGFCDFAEHKLYVSEEDPVNRQTFTIAHELGHWVLHRSLYTSNPERYRALPRFQQVDRKDPLEQEANCFAANLLVPTSLVKPVRHFPVSELANIFAVSREMMEFRLKNVR